MIVKTVNRYTLPFQYHVQKTIRKHIFGGRGKGQRSHKILHPWRVKDRGLRGKTEFLRLWTTGKRMESSHSGYVRRA